MARKFSYLEAAAINGAVVVNNRDYEKNLLILCEFQYSKNSYDRLLPLA